MSSEDPFRYLEAATPERSEWEQTQNSKSRDLLHAQRGFADALQRVRAYRGAAQPPRQVEVRGTATYLLMRMPDSGATAIVRRRGNESVTLFQLGGSSVSGRSRIDFMNVSPSGKYVAIGTSDAGTEETVVRFIETQTGRELQDRLADVRTGALDWLADETGALYMRGRGRKSVPVKDQSRDFSVALHVLGTESRSDVEIVGSHARGPRIHDDFEYCYPSVSPDGVHTIISVRRGVNPDLTIYTKLTRDLLAPAIEWQKVYTESDRVKTTSLGSGRLLAVRSIDESTNVIEEVALASPSQRRIVYSTSRPLDKVLAAGTETYAVELDLGTKRLLSLRGGAKPTDIALPGSRSVWSDGVKFDPTSNRVVLDLRSWVEQPTYWTVSMNADRAVPLTDVPSAATTGQRFDVRAVEAESRDGERIPLTIVRRADVDTPKYVWVTAYGAYGTVSGPSFTIARRTFLELGGTYVFAHVRGGGEKGRAWHTAGRGANKAKTVEDLIDALKYLRKQGFGGNGGGVMIYGASAGALPVGGVLAREPGLVSAAAIESGLVNVSRLDEGNSTGVLHAEEIGSNATPEGARRLRELDVYLNIRAGVNYPSTLISCGVNDARVPHWQSDKLVARLQSVGAKTFFRVMGGGHGVGNTDDEESDADAELVTFALSNTGHPDFK